MKTITSVLPARFLYRKMPEYISARRTEFKSDGVFNLVNVTQDRPDVSTAFFSPNLCKHLNRTAIRSWRSSGL